MDEDRRLTITCSYERTNVLYMATTETQTGGRRHNGMYCTNSQTTETNIFRRERQPYFPNR
jgi:hypothetical protein